MLNCLQIYSLMYSLLLLCIKGYSLVVPSRKKIALEAGFPNTILFSKHVCGTDRLFFFNDTFRGFVPGICFVAVL